MELEPEVVLQLWLLAIAHLTLAFTIVGFAFMIPWTRESVGEIAKWAFLWPLWLVYLFLAKMILPSVAWMLGIKPKKKKKK